MKQKNLKRAAELSQERERLERLYNVLIDVKPGSINHIGMDEDPGIIGLSAMKIDSLDKLKCTLLGLIEQEIEGIDKEVNEL